MVMAMNSRVSARESFRNKKFSNRIYNPVLKDHSELTEWIKVDKTLNHRRQKRQASTWSCRGICEQSLCPWTKRVDFDDKRIPASIAKAVCSKECNFNFTESKMPTVLNVLTTCEPLTTDIPIFKNNKETYLKNWPIACICSRRKISQISRIPQIHKKGYYAQRSVDVKKRIAFHKTRRHKPIAKHHQKLRHLQNNKYYNIKQDVKPFWFQ